jgi:site-specific recombinase XerD
VNETTLTTTATSGLAFQPIVNLVVDGLGSEHSRRGYSRALADFFAWYDGQGRPGLSKAAVQTYKRKLRDDGLAPATVNQRLAAVRKLAQEAADNGLLDPVLAAGVGRVKGVRASRLPAGRSLTSGEITAMFAACAQDTTPAGARDAAVLALLRLGLRRAEVAGLELADVDLEGETAKVRGKGDKEREVPLAGGALAALADWLRVRGNEPGPLLLEVNKGGRVVRKGIGAQAVYGLLGKRAEQAGVRDVTPHDWRRSFVGDLLDAGADLATVQRLVGHADPKTTSRYDRRPAEARRKAIGLLHVPHLATS